MKCCGADLNHNLWLNLVIAALMGFSESIWTNTIGVAFIYDVWGGSNTKGISNGPAQALLADSVPTGQRSKFYNWLFVSYIVPSLLGPVISVVYFEVKGNDWSMGALRDLMCLGLVLEVPVGLLSCLFRDDKALGAESDAVQDRRASDFSETPSGDFVSLTDVEDWKEGEPPKEGGAPAGAPEPPAADEENEKLAADPRVARVPYVVFATDLVVALGSGMTVKFFPLFFKNDCGMSPASVQGIYAVLLLRLGGLCCFGAMVVLFDRGFAAGHAKWAIVAFYYVVRTALMNCTYPLEESILMDYVPKHTRARWKSLESVSMFGWCGSALAGGVLADKFGYTRTFLITIGLQGTGMLFYAQLLGIVAKEADLQKQAPPPDADLAAPLLAGDEPATSVQ
ncbi:major facilitator superfamily-like protein [Aureococcus anophagefferens]|nr:major facilitator superfamily-like protein [Aureococcus anophagefferens]